jgi:molecular chaperone GrpE
MGNDDAQVNENNYEDYDREDLIAELDKLETEVKAEKDAKLTALADLQNYRKRAEKEKSELTTMANVSILRALVELVDDFERMVEDLDKPDEEDQIDAFKPVLDKAKGILIDYGVEEIPVEPGDKMDPDKMEAIGTVEVDDNDQVGKVIHVAEKGYKYTKTGNMLRHARVIVGKND